MKPRIMLSLGLLIMLSTVWAFAFACHCLPAGWLMDISGLPTHWWSIPTLLSLCLGGGAGIVIGGNLVFHYGDKL